MKNNIWGTGTVCKTREGEPCTACCVALGCPLVTIDGCGDYKHRPKNCRMFDCSSLKTDEQEKLRSIHVSAKYF